MKHQQQTFQAAVLLSLLCGMISPAASFVATTGTFSSSRPAAVFGGRTATTASTSTNLRMSLSTAWAYPTWSVPAGNNGLLQEDYYGSLINSNHQQVYSFRDYQDQSSSTPTVRPPLEIQQEKTAAAANNNNNNKYRIFCDLDGVLVDFEAGIQQLFPEHTFSSSSHHQKMSSSSGTTASSASPDNNNNDSTDRSLDHHHHHRRMMGPDDLNRHEMWHRVEHADQPFFESLPWCTGGQRLWKAIQHLQPDILTGVPTYQSSRIQKLQWCRRELRTVLNMKQNNNSNGNDDDDDVILNHVDMAGQWRSHERVNGEEEEESTTTYHHRSTNNNNSRQTTRSSSSSPQRVCNVITCWSDNKHHESGPNAILIDDRECLRAKWEAAGGIFIHHCTVDDTLAQLRAIGVHVNDDDDDDDDNDNNGNNDHDEYYYSQHHHDDHHHHEGLLLP